MSSKQDIEFLEYIDSSANRLAELSDENRSLREKVAELSSEKVILQKVATAKPFEDEEVERVVGIFGDSRLIDPLQTEKVASLLKGDHKKFIDLMTKIAESTTIYSSGEGIASDPDPESSDPDGWGAMVSKRR